MVRDVHAFCLRILEAGDLQSKLMPVPDTEGEPLPDRAPSAGIVIDRPARDPEIRLEAGVPPLPRPGELVDGAARASCLARFAHHELMAVELFAWALLRWPALPQPLRHALFIALQEEQTHCRLYLSRLEATGSRFTEHPHSDYFWKHAPAIANSPHGPRAFLAAMGLTLEQANLDFALLYRDAFREAGDKASARVCQRIHDDEIRHVGLAAHWLLRLSPQHRGDQRAAYEEAVPFPLSAARAKARRFDAEGRRRAGLSESFIEYVRTARSPQELRGRGQQTSSGGA